MLDMCFMACLSILKWLPITLQPRVVYVLGDRLQERKNNKTKPGEKAGQGKISWNNRPETTMTKQTKIQQRQKKTTRSVYTRGLKNTGDINQEQD